jgi:hypothetical protein
MTTKTGLFRRLEAFEKLMAYPGYWDRLVARVLEEAKPENGGTTMEELFGMPPDEEGQ